VQEGADVAFTDLVINEAAEETIAEIAAFGHKVKGYASNAANFDETHAVVEEILKEFGHIDILVNNAGITKDGLVLRMSEAQWDAVIAVNLKSAFNFIHAVIPSMARQKGGSIINMASIAGQMGNPGQINYASSKAGLIAMAKTVAKEMGSRGIRANAIAPGFIVSEMTNALPEAVREEYIKSIPLKRGGTVEEIANTALYLGSDLSSYVTGQVIAVNGGLYC
jgi:3-oxoacyl-[acyl-carrier protein] reductase